MKDHPRVLFYKNYDNESYIKIVEEYNKISIEYKGEKKVLEISIIYLIDI